MMRIAIDVLPRRPRRGSAAKLVRMNKHIIRHYTMTDRTEMLLLETPTPEGLAIEEPSSKGKTVAHEIRERGEPVLHSAEADFGEDETPCILARTSRLVELLANRGALVAFGGRARATASEAAGAE